MDTRRRRVDDLDAGRRACRAGDLLAMVSARVATPLAAPAFRFAVAAACDAAHVDARRRRADGFDAGRRARRSGVQLAMVSARFRSAANVLLGCFHLPPSSQSWTFQSKGHVAEGAVLKHS